MNIKLLQAVVIFLFIGSTSINAIAKPRGSHKVELLETSETGFCDYWLAYNQHKKGKSLAISETGNMKVKIDGIIVEFREVSRKGTTNNVGGKHLTVYQSDRYSLRVDLVHTSNRNYQLLSEGYVIVSDGNWTKKIKIKSGCDTAG